MLKILVVEDDAMNRDMLTRYLKRVGFDTVTAADGARAIALARTEQPALILMDMGLPVLNGWQATHRIKHLAETQHIPIIALTAYTLAESRLQSLAVGCNEYETKPIDFDRLLSKIRQLLPSTTDTPA